jgi:hypothetical protein
MKGVNPMSQEVKETRYQGLYILFPRDKWHIWLLSLRASFLALRIHRVCLGDYTETSLYLTRDK